MLTGTALPVAGGRPVDCLRGVNAGGQDRPALRLRSDASSLELQATGKVRINGHRLLIDVDTNVRVLSALVELP